MRSRFLRSEILRLRFPMRPKTGDDASFAWNNDEIKFQVPERRQGRISSRLGYKLGFKSSYRDFFTALAISATPG